MKNRKTENEGKKKFDLKHPDSCKLVDTFLWAGLGREGVGKEGRRKPNQTKQPPNKKPGELD